jgi:anti-sigma regulatory factor (Ser/Thr protein kinase)
MAMEEGFSTAGDESRRMGVGAGLGLPNIKQCVSSLDVDTKLGGGTQATMYLDL